MFWSLAAYWFGEGLNCRWAGHEKHLEQHLI